MAPKTAKSTKKRARKAPPAVKGGAPGAPQAPPGDGQAPAGPPVRRDRLGRPWKPRKQNLPQHEPTPETRAAVTALNALGKTHGEIAKYLSVMMNKPISAKGVGRYYAEECSVGLMHQQLLVSQNYLRKCTGSPAQYDKQGNMIRAEVRSETVAQIFWLKARAGWVDRQVVDHQGVKDAPPIVHKHEHTLKTKTPLPDLSKLSDEELAKLYREEVAKGA